MARKLWLGLVVGLLALVPAAGSLAEIYKIEVLGDNANYTWRHGYPDYEPGTPKDPDGIPWNAWTEFIAGGPTYDAALADAAWKIGFYVTNPSTDYRPYENTNPGIQNPDGSYTIVFDSTTASPRFFLNGSKINNVPDISSADAIITYTAKYTYQGPGLYSLVEGTIIGTGTNSLDGTPFRFTASLQEALGNHQNAGYLNSFTLEYPYNAAAVPLPGSLLLLASGLLGLACLGRRRRK